MRAKTAPTASKRSIVDYVLDQRRKACKICRLPQEVRDELRAAAAKHITRAIQIEWLKVEHGVDVTSQDFVSHYGGRHDG